MTGDAAEDASDREPPDPNRWRALTVCLVALTLTLIDVSITAVALPSISRSIHAGPSELQWVVSGYALGFGMVPIIAGRLGDDYGRRLLLMIGVGAFGVTSAVVGLAPNPAVLIGGRVVQGMAGGLLNPQVSGFVQLLFRGRERARAFALLGLCVGVGTATGPVLGGALLTVGGSNLGWRLAFVVNIPVSIAAFVLCLRWLPAPAKSQRRSEHRRLDLVGAGLLALAVFSTLFPAVEFDSSHDPRLAFVLIPAAALFVAFVAWERGPARRSGYPLIDMKLFAIRSYASGFVIALLFTGAGNSTPIVLSLFLQEGLGATPLQAGLEASAAAIGVGAGSVVAGRLMQRPRGDLLVPALVLFIGANALLAVTARVAAGSGSFLTISLAIVVPLLAVGFAIGLVLPINQTAVLADVDARGGSTAGGMFQSAQRLSTAVETAVVTAVFYVLVSSATRVPGVARSRDYATAYLAGVLVVAALGLATLVVARASQQARGQRRPPSRWAGARLVDGSGRAVSSGASEVSSE